MTERLFTLEEVKMLAGFRPTPDTDEEWTKFIADLESRGWLNRPTDRPVCDRRSTMHEGQSSSPWDESLVRLRAVAEAADESGRRWFWKGGYPQNILREGDVVLVAQTLTDPDHRPEFAEFIAAFDPPTVLAMIDRLLLLSRDSESER